MRLSYDDALTRDAQLRRRSSRAILPCSFFSGGIIARTPQSRKGARTLFRSGFRPTNMRDHASLFQLPLALSRGRRGPGKVLGTFPPGTSVRNACLLSSFARRYRANAAVQEKCE